MSRYIALSRAFALVACTAALAACNGGANSALPKLAQRQGTTDASLLKSKIKNIIVVIFENRSFDNMMQFYPGRCPMAQPCTDNTKANIANITGTAMYKGQPVTLQPQTLAASSTDSGHSHSDYLADLNVAGGKTNDGWDTIAYGYVPQSEVQPDIDIAKEFAISDSFFHGLSGPTFPSHVEIGGATTYGVIGNPSDNTWGCDAKPGTVTDLFDKNAPGEVDNGKGPYPCFDELSIFDVLDRALPTPTTWRFYSEPMGDSAAGNEEIPGYYRQIRFGPDWNNDIANSDLQLETDITAGALKQVSMVIPNEGSTDHAGTPSLGPMYLETLVNDFGESQYYNNTLMIITWDDWGGWYDHVVPPADRSDGTQYSFRKPIIFVGGYVKQGYVSHVQTEDASIAKTIENLYNLDTLGAHDVAAADFSDVINPNATPAPFTPITSLEVPSTSAASTSMRPQTRSRPLFRVVPSNFMGKDAHGKYFSGNADYYGSRSADY